MTQKNEVRDSRKQRLTTQGLLSQKTDSDLILRLYTGNNLLRIVFLRDHFVNCVNRKICQLYLNDAVKKNNLGCNVQNGLEWQNVPKTMTKQLQWSDADCVLD